ncbi:hypothetical protein OAB10_04675 [Candidatus Pelagibacter sp.]|nr:hypothetical protein [Candidatus Pelagibacter sp.]
MSLKFKKLIVIYFLSIFFIKPSIAEITFLEILENPSDLEINLKYAKEQEALGQYKATLSTLERLNMLYPVNTDLKLYLISILLKLDSEAKLQLMLETMMQDPNTSDETRQYIEKTLATIRKQSEEPKRKWFAFADLSYMQTDHSNVDGVSKSGDLFVLNGVDDMDGIKYDKTYSRTASITVGKNIDKTSAISLNTGLNINTQNKGAEGENDLSFGSLTYSKILNKHFLMPFIFYSRPNQRDSATADSNTKGVGFNNTYSIDNTKSITYGSTFSSTIFNKKGSNVEDNPDNGNNLIFSGNVGFNYIFSDVNLISTKISLTNKEAESEYNGYLGHGLNIGYTRILPFGNLKIEKTYQTNVFDEKNSFIHTGIDREDDIEVSQIQLSGRIIQLIPSLKKTDPVGQLFFNLKYNKSDSESTILQNSAIRETTSFNITKRFSLYE